MLVNSGLNKFFNHMPMPERSQEIAQAFTSYVSLKWVLPLVALVGGTLFALPKYRALGALVTLPVMVGIGVHHLVLDPTGLGVGLIMFLTNLCTLRENREKFALIVS